MLGTLVLDVVRRFLTVWFVCNPAIYNVLVRISSLLLLPVKLLAHFRLLFNPTSCRLRSHYKEKKLFFSVSVRLCYSGQMRRNCMRSARKYDDLGRVKKKKRFVLFFPPFEIRYSFLKCLANRTL